MKLRTHKKGRPNRFDLVLRAKALGVTHGHLGRVLAGKREGRSLLARYASLIAVTPVSQSTQNKI